MRVIEWVKGHKLSSLLLGVIIIYLLPGFFGSYVTSNLRTGISSGPYFNYSSKQSEMMAPGGTGGYDYAGVAKRELPIGMVTGNQNRMVQKESSMSLLVKDVRESGDIVIKQAEGLGGFMIQSSYSNPGESPSGSITVRVPSSSLAVYLDILRKQSIRVASEELTGTDITDQYKDINSRLMTLNNTRRKFDDIYEKAILIPDILEVQNRLIELQDQIDSLKGQQQYMEKSSEMARVSVYLSTDEFSLPYAADSSWRPEVVFKTAVRSLVENLRGLAGMFIWISVYAVLWVPTLIFIVLVRRYIRNKRTQR